jgi:hypothetical protein
MKQLFRNILFLFLLFFLASCEEGVFGSLQEPGQQNCLEINQENSNGLAIERVYKNRRITEYRNYDRGNLQSYYAFTYGSGGRITESVFFNVVKNTQSPPDVITYNDQGKWVESSMTFPNGDVNSYFADYDSQNQIKTFTYTITKSGVSTTQFTVTYTWEGGNNIRRSYSSPTQQSVTQYVFDMERENKRRKEQEKISFLSSTVIYNKNMYARAVTTTTTATTTTERITEYDFQYNEYGYPISAMVTNTTGSGAPTLTTTYFDYTCF